MSKVPPTYLNQEAKLKARHQELADELEAIEKYWNERGASPAQIQFADFTQFNLRTKFTLIFELLRELTGKTPLEMDIRLFEIMLEQIKEVTPQLEEAQKQARLAAILDGVPTKAPDPNA